MTAVGSFLRPLKLSLDGLWFWLLLWGGQLTQFLLLLWCGKGYVLDSLLTVGFVYIFSIFLLLGWSCGAIIWLVSKFNNCWWFKKFVWSIGNPFSSLYYHCISSISRGFPKWKSCWNECFDLSSRIVGMILICFTVDDYTSSMIWMLSGTISTLDCITFIRYKLISFTQKKLNLGIHVKHEPVTSNYLCFQRIYLITGSIYGGYWFMNNGFTTLSCELCNFLNVYKSIYLNTL